MYVSSVNVSSLVQAGGKRLRKVSVYIRILTNDANIIHESTSKDMAINYKIQQLAQNPQIRLFTR